MALNTKEPQSRDVLWLDPLEDIGNVVIKIYNNGEWRPLWRGVCDFSIKYREVKTVPDIVIKI